MKQRKKQFIAGAVCPECDDTDSLVLYSDDKSIACVSCDFTKTSEQRDSKEPDNEPSTQSRYKDASSIDFTQLDK
ncbi:MAG: YheV family putative metal-binding protein [Kangiellaceae bacterium]|nr:YheV family putative metal-binding protein [Kangiellaceae bacterium]